VTRGQPRSFECASDRSEGLGGTSCVHAAQRQCLVQFYEQVWIGCLLKGPARELLCR
jgi:hypothetical protein